MTEKKPKSEAGSDRGSVNSPTSTAVKLKSDLLPKMVSWSQARAPSPKPVKPRKEKIILELNLEKVIVHKIKEKQ